MESETRERIYREVMSEVNRVRKLEQEVIDRKYRLLAVNPCNGRIRTEYNAIVFSADDLGVPGMLERYYDECKGLGCSSSHLESIQLLTERVRKRQAESGGRTPDTDSPCEIDRCIGGKI